MRGDGFKIFPEKETPFTYHLEESFSTIDYVLSRGFVISEFEVADQYAITQHRPLFVKVQFPSSDFATDTLQLFPALGAAYIRSQEKQATIRQLLASLASECDDGWLTTPQGIQFVYDRLENIVELCTKRTVCKQHLKKWEYELDPADAETLHQARADFLLREQRLSPSSTRSELMDVQTRAQLLGALRKELQRKAVDNITQRQRQQAQHHASTWKLLASFKATSDQPEVPPSEVFDHYRKLSHIPSLPLELELQPRRWQGPLSSEDALLEEDVTPAETRAAIEESNMSSAPGPDGLPPTLVRSWFESTLLLTFLSRIFTACFHRAYTPAQWRKSENFVLYKGVGDKANVGSFRAISLTASFAKFFERVLFKRVWVWFSRSALFRLPQFGFRPRCSTIDAVFLLLSLIRQHTTVCNVPFHVAFVDISKAFPSVDRFQLFDR
jgi:hypothetical protein